MCNAQYIDTEASDLDADDSEVECEDKTRESTDNEENGSHNGETKSTRESQQPAVSLFPTGDSVVADASSNTVTIIVGGVVGSLLGFAIVIAAIAVILVVWKLTVKKRQSKKGSGIDNTSGGTPGYHNAVYGSKHAGIKPSKECIHLRVWEWFHYSNIKVMPTVTDVLSVFCVMIMHLIYL